MSKVIKNLRKKITLLAVAMIALQPVLGLAMMPTKTFAGTNHLVISEIQIGTSSSTNDDFIELYNPIGSPVNLKDFRLVKRTAGGTSDTLIKAWTTDTFINANSYYLWANSGYGGISADTTTTLSIAENNGVALKDGAGTIIDSVGLGTATNAFVETKTVTPNPPDDTSVERKANSSSTSVTMAVGGADATKGNAYDTENNSNDFIARAIPQPQNSSSPAEDIIAPSAPDKNKITVNQNDPGTNDEVTGSITGAVEALSIVTVYKDAALTSPSIGTGTAKADGSFDAIDIGDNKADSNDLIYITSTDANGNESLPTKLANDTTGPEMQGVANIPVESSTGSEVVDYTLPTATDTGSGLASPVVCAPPSGSSFSLGDTPVTCTATDNAGNVATETFTVTVMSSVVVTPPVVGPPAPVVTTAVAEVPVDNQVYGAESYQGEVKADTTIQTDEGNTTEVNNDEQPEDTKGESNVPLWGIIFLLILAGIGGYLFYSQGPEKTGGK